MTTPTDAQRLEVLRQMMTGKTPRTHPGLKDSYFLLEVIDRQQAIINKQHTVLEAARRLMDMAIDPAIPDLLNEPLAALEESTP
jgi:hypothetical protein